MNRVFKDLPQLVQDLKEQRARQKDLVVHTATMSMVEKTTVMMSIETEEMGGVFGLTPEAHNQLADKLKIPGKYYERCQNEAHGLLCGNVNHWLTEEAKKNVKRFIRIQDNDVRAILSSRYRPINHLDLVTTAALVVSGQTKEDSEQPNYAKGARGIGWSLTPKYMDVCFTNPSIVVDLNHVENGVKAVDVKSTGDSCIARAGKMADHTEFGRNRDEGGSHPVFPAARIRNSETGHGGLTVQAGIFEAVCANTAWIGHDLVKVHLGRDLGEDEIFSEDTYKKMNSVLFAQVADVIRSVFDPASFLSLCEKFKGLQKVQIDVKEAVNKVIAIPGMNEELRDDILAAYAQSTQGIDTAYDLQRAITASAHTVREGQPELAYMLEELGGKMIEEGIAVLG